jgi:hypothetical protein
MNSASSELGGLEYGTPTQSNNNLTRDHILNVLENLTTNHKIISMLTECQVVAGMAGNLLQWETLVRISA